MGRRLRRRVRHCRLRLEECHQVVEIVVTQDCREGRHVAAASGDYDAEVVDAQPMRHIGQVHERRLMVAQFYIESRERALRASEEKYPSFGP
jgi:hypothetical protein